MHGLEKEGKIVLYVNCAAGIAGDMFLAALTDISGDEGYLRAELAKLPLAGYSVKLFRDVRRGISGLRFEVEADEGHVHRHLGDIRQIITESGLPARVKAETIRAFTLLAEAEAKVHGTDIDSVHFHEVGAVDSIIDLTGAMIMLDRLGWPKVVFSPLNIGGGTVNCVHGVLQVPAPAVAELLKGVSVYSEGEPMERVTPTGAALVKALGASVSPAMPGGKIENTGTGLGSRDSRLPNVLRVISLEAEDGDSFGDEKCVELCANIDDMTPQDLSAVMERLFEEGALDVWFEPIQMKKNRPAVKLCCLGSPDSRAGLAGTILRETTTLGVRVLPAERYTLERRVDEFETPLGTVRIKSALSDGAVVKQAPEFDDVLRLSKRHGMPILAVREILASQDFVPDTGEKAPGGAEGPRRHSHDHNACHGHERHDHREQGRDEGQEEN